MEDTEELVPTPWLECRESAYKEQILLIDILLIYL